VVLGDADAAVVAGVAAEPSSPEHPPAMPAARVMAMAGPAAKVKRASKVLEKEDRTYQQPRERRLARVLG
jgi:hypothetical protein